MRRYWPRSLAAQIICFMLPIMLLAQSIGFFVTADQRAQELRTIAHEEFVVRSAAALRMIETTPAEYQGAVLEAMGTNYSRFWLSDSAPGSPDDWSRDAWRRLHLPLGGTANGGQSGNTNPWGAAGSGNSPWGITDSPALQSTTPVKAPRWRPIALDTSSRPAPAQYVALDNNYGSGLVARLPGGMWLNAAYAKPPKKLAWLSPSTVSLAITAIVLSLLSVLVARRIARPMQRLTRAAEALGRGEQHSAIPEDGPDDIRRTAVAFNQMQERLARVLADRTRMLAAIGHDLRTPITTMRLRAELVTDPETRARLLDTINEMQMITEAALEFTQEQLAEEPTRPVDVAALVDSICDDLADLGRDVRFIESGVTPYRCRPSALRRAVRNLIENAIRYGESAEVSVVRSADGVHIVIEDNGPGIPDDEMERVFLPFVRLEESRNAATGGIGLGLSIARSVARHHGGDIVLSNRPRGLRATIRLPEIAEALA